MEQSVALRSSNVSVATYESHIAVRLDKSIPHYKAIDRNIRIDWLTNTIIQMNALGHTGNRPDLRDVAYSDAMNLDALIMQDFYISDFTLPEISEAFMAGVTGRYGDYYGISALSLFKFLVGYWESPKKREVYKAVLKQREEEKKRREYEAFLKEQKERMKMEGWGVPMHTIKQQSLDSVAEGMKMDNADYIERRDREHRERVREQARQIIEEYGREHNK